MGWKKQLDLSTFTYTTLYATFRYKKGGIYIMIMIFTDVPKIF